MPDSAVTPTGQSLVYGKIINLNRKQYTITPSYMESEYAFSLRHVNCYLYAQHGLCSIQEI